MLWVLKRTVTMHPKHMLKLMGKKIFITLLSKILLINRAGPREVVYRGALKAEGLNRAASGGGGRV